MAEDRVPGGGTAAARLWDRATRRYITPADARWPALDSGVNFSTDGKFVSMSPTTAAEVVDIWNIAARSLAVTVSVSGSPDEELMDVGPGGSELLSTGALNISTGTFSKLLIWAVPV